MKTWKWKNLQMFLNGRLLPEAECSRAHEILKRKIVKNWFQVHYNYTGTLDEAFNLHEMFSSSSNITDRQRPLNVSAEWQKRVYRFGVSWGPVVFGHTIVADDLSPLLERNPETGTQFEIQILFILYFSKLHHFLNVYRLMRTSLIHEVAPNFLCCHTWC